MGRETLQRTATLAEQQLALDVIYGDTDSIMINTRSTDLAHVKDLGNQVKREVNKLYKLLELELDGVFKSMLLLKKKKYAALVVKEKADGTVTYEKELKGLDLVRRDWCVLSKETGQYVVNQILSGESRDTVVDNIHNHMSELASKMRAGELDLAQYVITKGLNKHPNDYPDAKGQPHLQVALAMIKEGKAVTVGNHIPYVICQQQQPKKEGEAGSKTSGASNVVVPSVGCSVADQARHPNVVTNSNSQLKVDIEWYLSQQILPPIARLCEPIEGTSQGQLASQLGLDASKFRGPQVGGGSSSTGDDLDPAFTPLSKMEDAERFRDVRKLQLACLKCKEEEAEFPGVYMRDQAQQPVGSGLNCPKCGEEFWGAPNAGACFSRLHNRMTLLLRQCQQSYYDCWLVCEDSSCGARTQQQSVRGPCCLARGCRGRLSQEYSEQDLHTQLKYFESLFDAKRAQRMLAEKSLNFPEIPKKHVELFKAIKQMVAKDAESSAYNWIQPDIWSTVFGKK